MSYLGKKKCYGLFLWLISKTIMLSAISHKSWVAIVLAHFKLCLGWHLVEYGLAFERLSSRKRINVFDKGSDRNCWGLEYWDSGGVRDLSRGEPWYYKSFRRISRKSECCVEVGVGAEWAGTIQNGVLASSVNE